MERRRAAMEVKEIVVQELKERRATRTVIAQGIRWMSWTDKIV
jgi:hypothetical protein